MVTIVKFESVEILILIFSNFVPKNQWLIFHANNFDSTFLLSGKMEYRLESFMRSWLSYQSQILYK